MEIKRYWYIAKGQVPEAEKVVTILSNRTVGFLFEPDYQIIEKYDLREIGYGDMHWLTNKYL